MDDSPLSITASITGILTFLAAIIAFVYIRYTILRHAEREMLATFDSIVETLEETRLLAEAQKQESIDDPAAERLSNIISQLYETEFSIMLQYMKVYGVEDLVKLLSRLPSPLPADGSNSVAWEHAANEAQELLREQRQARRSVGHGLQTALLRVTQTFDAMDVFIQSTPGLASLTWTMVKQSVMIVVRVGKTPRLVRWYMVRDDIQEKMQKRETIRSRILLYHATKSTAQLNSHGKNVHDLLANIGTFEAHLRGLDAQIQDAVEKQEQANAILLREITALRELTSGFKGVDTDEGHERQ